MAEPGRGHSADSDNGELGSGAAVLFAVSALAIGIGTVSAELDAATLLIALAFVVATLGLFASGMSRLQRLRPRAVVDVLSVAIVIYLAMAVLDPPVNDPLYRLAIVGVTVAALWLIRYATTGRSVGVALVVASHFGLMAWALSVNEPPLIDVIQFQQEGSEALLAGQNPYSLRFINIYGPDTSYYASEVIDGDRVTFGFPYPPLTLLMALPGFVLAGDFRYAAAAAVSITVLLIAHVRPGRVAVGAALLFMLAPPVWRVLYNGWNEAFVVPILAAAIYAAARQSSVTPTGLGLLIATKQYLVPLWLVGVVLLRSVRRKLGLAPFVATSIGVAGIVTIPFVLWDPESFFYSTVTFHNLQPFRIDALSITALAARSGLPEAPSWIGFLGGGLVLLLILIKAPRSPMGATAGSALALLAFFLLGKQAFVNYYFVCLAALSGAVALCSSMAQEQAGEKHA